jgi:hypothetical protein
MLFFIVDPPIPGAADRAVKLRSQQEVHNQCHWCWPDRCLILTPKASRPRVYSCTAGDEPSATDKAERGSVLSGLACQECEAYAFRYTLLCFDRSLLKP